MVYEKKNTREPIPQVNIRTNTASLPDNMDNPAHNIRISIYNASATTSINCAIEKKMPQHKSFNK